MALYRIYKTSFNIEWTRRWDLIQSKPNIMIITKLRLLCNKLDVCRDMCCKKRRVEISLRVSIDIKTQVWDYRYVGFIGALSTYKFWSSMQKLTYRSSVSRYITHRFAAFFSLESTVKFANLNNRRDYTTFTCIICTDAPRGTRISLIPSAAEISNIYSTELHAEVIMFPHLYESAICVFSHTLYRQPR